MTSQPASTGPRPAASLSTGAARPGCGLPRRAGIDLSSGGQAAAVAAADTVRAGRFGLFCAPSAVCFAAAMAAKCPERVKARPGACG
jgi:hypothetical protein